MLELHHIFIVDLDPGASFLHTKMVTHTDDTYREKAEHI